MAAALTILLATSFARLVQASWALVLKILIIVEVN